MTLTKHIAIDSTLFLALQYVVAAIHSECESKPELIGKQLQVVPSGPTGQQQEEQKEEQDQEQEQPQQEQEQQGPPRSLPRRIFDFIWDYQSYETKHINPQK